MWLKELAELEKVYREYVDERRRSVTDEPVKKKVVKLAKKKN